MEFGEAGEHGLIVQQPAVMLVLPEQDCSCVTIHHQYLEEEIVLDKAQQIMFHAPHFLLVIQVEV
jgi:hypothetical protein